MRNDNLSITEKFGQMIMIGLDTYEINEEIINLIKDFKIGGVILYKKNYTSFKGMQKAINKLKKANKDNKIPLFIAIDQENGRVNRMPKEILPIYNAYQQGLTGNLKIIEEVNDITITLLKSCGINMNLAPVLDVWRNPKNKVIGNRSYGKSTQSVIKYAIPLMKSLQKNKIISVVKHFPNHGLVSIDSHLKIPKIREVKKLEKDLIVYQSAINAGCDAIMVGHLKVCGYGFKPATINPKIIQHYLIDYCQYNGLIISDDLRMNHLKYFYGIKKTILKALDANINVLMVKYHKNDLKKVYEKLYKMVNNYEVDIEKIENSYQKIVAIKKKYQINDKLCQENLNISKINDRIKLINQAIENN